MAYHRVDELKPRILILDFPVPRLMGRSATTRERFDYCIEPGVKNFTSGVIHPV
jgi:hypothetical protein